MSNRTYPFLWQVVSADTHLARMRHERGVKELLQAAKTKLENILAMAKDAASSSVEVVWEYLYDLEAQVLNSATDQLYAQGIQVNLTTISHLMRSNVKGCVTDVSMGVYTVQASLISFANGQLTVACY